MAWHGMVWRFDYMAVVSCSLHHFVLHIICIACMLIYHVLLVAWLLGMEGWRDGNRLVELVSEALGETIEGEGMST